MGGKSRWDYLKAIYVRYQEVSKPLRAQILNEFCQVCDYNRKYAIRLLNGPVPQKPKTIVRKGRRSAYSAKVISALAAIWEAAGYPCSVRLKALMPLWLPWAIKGLGLTVEMQKQLLAISPATMDRRLKGKRGQLKNASVRAHQARHLAQTPYPDPRPTTGMSKRRALPRSIWLSLRQLGFRRVPALAQRHRHPHHLGGKPCGDGEKPDRGAQRHAGH